MTKSKKSKSSTDLKKRANKLDLKWDDNKILLFKGTHLAIVHRRRKNLEHALILEDLGKADFELEAIIPAKGSSHGDLFYLWK